MEYFLMLAVVLLVVLVTYRPPGPTPSERAAHRERMRVAMEDLDRCLEEGRAFLEEKIHESLCHVSHDK